MVKVVDHGNIEVLVEDNLGIFIKNDDLQDNIYNIIQKEIRIYGIDKEINDLIDEVKVFDTFNKVNRNENFIVVIRRNGDNDGKDKVEVYLHSIYLRVLLDSLYHCNENVEEVVGNNSVIIDLFESNTE